MGESQGKEEEACQSKHEKQGKLSSNSVYDESIHKNPRKLGQSSDEDNQVEVGTAGLFDA